MHDSKRLQELFKNIPAGLVTLEISKNGAIEILYANEGFYRLTGYTSDSWKETYGEFYHPAIHKDDTKIWEKTYSPFFINEAEDRNKSIRFEFRAKHQKIGYVRLVFEGKMVMNQAEDRGSAIITVDAVLYKKIFGEQRLDSKELYKFNHYDKLTGLYHYHQFKFELPRMILRYGSTDRLALINFDISNFKYINDTYGMETGDEVLKRFSHFYMSQQPECLIGCRVYADNFYALIRVNEKHSLAEEIEKMNIAFANEQNVKYPGLYLSINSGIYFFEKGDQNAVNALDGAALAKKIAKETQETSVVVFSDTLLKEALKESRVLALIKEAIANQDVVPYLQPKVDLHTGKVVGAEALVRWKKDKEICFYPNDFIPILEKSGKIVELDFSIYEQILQKMKEWIDSGKKVIPISINLSRVHSKFPDCDMQIIQLADQYKIPYHLIEIEITESIFLGSFDRLFAKLGRLQQMGFIISIDDFGSGYSSLAMISQMPADVLKIDQSFLKMGIDSERSSFVIESIISMAQKMKMKVLCEGVETIEQVEFLKSCGCHLGQGYFFAKPMTVEEFEKEFIVYNGVQ